MSVPYNYEMVTNQTKMTNEALVLSDTVLDVEYAIIDFLLKSLFSECAAYYQKVQGNKRRLRRQLTSGQVIGISAQPNDIVTDGTYDGIQKMCNSSPNVFEHCHNLCL
jgi:hypothetical protein